MSEPSLSEKSSPVVFEIECLDGSEYRIDKKSWMQAILITFENADFRDVATGLVQETDEYYRNQEVPTEFGFTEKWPHSDYYNSHADLMPDVLFPYIKSILEEIAQGANPQSVETLVDDIVENEPDQREENEKTVITYSADTSDGLIDLETLQTL